MAAPTFSAADFLAAFQALLPRGAVWPRDPDAVQTEFWAGLAPTYARQTESAAGLLADSPPFSLDQMLPEWEETLGLPDPCGGSDQSIPQRVAQVIAKLTSSGGQSAAYFIALAAKLGYPGVTITNYAPFRAGRSSCGDPVGGVGWFFTWTVTAPSVPVFYFRAGASAAGDPLYSLASNELQCTITGKAPAHTTVLFAGDT